jgi:transposase
MIAKPFGFGEQIVRMKQSADKFDLRLRLVRFAQQEGVKPAARTFGTTPRTVRKWLRRYRQDRLAGLHELPRIPESCPHKISGALEQQIVGLRKRFPFMGARRLVFEHLLPCSHQSVSRVLKDYGLIQKRRKKHQKKKDLSKIKQHWKLFGQLTIDTKELRDIPHYWPQMKALDLPRVQYTAREIRSGMMFLAYAREKSAYNACLFAQVLLNHLRACGVPLKSMKVQTDNGSEFIGCYRQDRSRDGFEKTVQGFGAIHKRIPVRAWSYNSDVETVHATIESEFFDLENFIALRDFHQRVAAYQAYYNWVRPNMNKHYQSPWQIVHHLWPKMTVELARLPPLMLDWLGPDYLTREEFALRGDDVPWLPCLVFAGRLLFCRKGKILRLAPGNA